MRIVKPILFAQHDKTYIENMDEVVDFYFSDWKKEVGDNTVSNFVTYTNNNMPRGRNLVMFFTSIKTNRTYMLNPCVHTLELMYEAAVKSEPKITDITEQPFYNFSTPLEEVFVTRTPHDLVVHSSEVEALVFEIINGI